jgi:LacI family transcriptional regulator
MCARIARANTCVSTPREPLSTFESSAVAQEMTERLLAENLAGLYVAGGGISGVLAALRSTGRVGSLVVVGYELMDNVKTVLLDGTITLSVAHPSAKLAEEAITGMVRSAAAKADKNSHTRIVPFEIYTRENL